MGALMKLKHEWKYILKRAWSMRLAILTAISSTFPLFVTAIPTVWFGVLTMGLAVATAVSRLADQPGMDRRHEDRPVTEDRRKEET